MIRIPQVRVIDEEGEQLGVMPTPNALQLAQERGFDLVEVAPMSNPPVTKILDYGQYKYEQARRDKEAKKHQRSVEFKEVRLRVKIGKGDFDTKVKRATRFLEDGDRVKVTVQFRGREVSHAYIGRDLLNRFAELVAEYGTVDRQPTLEGRSMSMVLSAIQKPKPPRAPAPAEPKAKKKKKNEAAASQPAEPEPKKNEAAAPQPAEPEPKKNEAAAPQPAAPPVAKEEPKASPATSTGG
jgi:translation initiation factor IF-3